MSVVVVTFESLERAKNYAAEMDVAWPVLIDESRALYRAFGMERGSFRAIWSPRNWGAYMRAILRGRLPKLPHDDVYQLGGDVLVDPDGVIQLHHISQSPKDRPSIDSLLASLDSLKNL